MRTNCITVSFDTRARRIACNECCLSCWQKWNYVWVNECMYMQSSHYKCTVYNIALLVISSLTPLKSYFICNRFDFQPLCMMLQSFPSGCRNPKRFIIIKSPSHIKERRTSKYDFHGRLAMNGSKAKISLENFLLLSLMKWLFNHLLASRWQRWQCMLQLLQL